MGVLAVGKPGRHLGEAHDLHTVAAPSFPLFKSNATFLLSFTNPHFAVDWTIIWYLGPKTAIRFRTAKLDNLEKQTAHHMALTCETSAKTRLVGKRD